MSKLSLSIGMAVYDDLEGVWATVQALRMYHDVSDVELLVVDNNPHSPHGEAVRGFQVNSGGAFRYVPMPSPLGTAPPRQRVFEEARGDVVLCVDSHIFLAPRALTALRAHFDADPDSRDMLCGPMLMDPLGDNVATHFEDVWRAEMRGIWATDSRGVGPDGTPFEVPGQGLGAFAMLRKHWVGFNPNFRQFGGEEMYVHEKVRRAGGKVLCLPAFRWAHRFGRPSGIPYPLSLWHKVRNYVIGHRELGLPLDPVYHHFVTQGRFSQGEWDQLVASDPPPESPGAMPAHSKPSCGSCGQAPASLEAWYEQVAKAPSDINEHVPTLREYAARCDHVTEFGVRSGNSTVALLSGKPRRMVSYDVQHAPVTAAMKTLAAPATEYEFRVGDSRNVEIEETDLLLVDSVHTAPHVMAELANTAGKVRKYLVFHDTQPPWGETGEDGGPGVMPAIRAFLFQNREWTAIRHDLNNHGLMILSRVDEDKKQPPGALRKALNFTKALAAHAQAGQKLVSDEVHAARLELCVVCEHRFHDVCGQCGCPVDKKSSWAEQSCPLSPPKWEAVEA